jgi:hypothetical protein
MAFKVTNAFENVSEGAAMLGDVVDEGASAIAGRIP